MTIEDSKNIAHIRPNGDIQLLEDHLRGVAQLCSKFTSALGLSNVGKVIGLLHDLGKATPKFNQYISAEDSGFSRGSIDHSTAGAQYLSSLDFKSCKCYNQSPFHVKLCGEAANMMELCILSHHSGLIDCLSCDGIDKFTIRLEKDLGSDGLEIATNHINPHILEDAKQVFNSAVEQLVAKLDELIKTSNDVEDRGRFRVGLLERFLLSCLIDADHQDTRLFMDSMCNVNEKIPWTELCLRFDNYSSKLNTDGKINQMRREVSDRCFEYSFKETGVYTLSVPTGGGKTLASLRFALNHALKNNLDRIIYVIPYTSIIDQNVSVIRKVLEKDGDKIVLEYHSNIDKTEDDLETSIWRYYSDSWDVQIVVTTMVQYMNCLFASGSGNIKKMHNLSNSVIIFDEIQTLPIKCTHMFNESVNFLSSICGSTILLCTATQPLLSKVEKYPLRIGENSEIISSPEKLSENFKRCDVKYVNPDKPMNIEEIIEFIDEQNKSFKSILIITNTKTAASEIFCGLEERIGNKHNLFHLSTNMCSVHRKIVLGNIRNSLQNGKTICVSTQLIEAGVDLDFECVIRMLAGIDSIAQAAGRCNRNGLMNHLGTVYVIATEENLSSLIDIREGRKCSYSVLREFDDPLSLDALTRYYEYYFYQRMCDMGYPIDSDNTLFDKLSVNRVACTLYRNNAKQSLCRLLTQSFNYANSTFRMIDENDSVIVPYDQKSKYLISELCSESGAHNTYDLLRSLQMYTISVYDIADLSRKKIVYEAVPESGIYILLEGYYDKNLGMIKKAINTTMVF